MADETEPETPKPTEQHATREPWPEFDDRPWCVTHTQREPCGICQSYIAAGL